MAEKHCPTCRCDYFSVGERVAAYDHHGVLLGRGRVTSSQRMNGLYMKVRLDGGVEAIVAQESCKRLVRVKA